MIEKAKYNFLKNKYAHIASWAIWDKAPSGEEKTKKNIDGDEWCSNDKDLLQRIHGKYVFVATNPYNEQTISKQIEKKESRHPWNSNFHSPSPHAQDYKLRYATEGTEMEGAYITDLIKDVHSHDVNKLKKEMKNDPSILARNIAEFKKELAHLSDKPIIVALGNDVYNWLKPLYNEYKVFKMSHYSRYINLDKYRKEAIAIIKSCK